MQFLGTVFSRQCCLVLHSVTSDIILDLRQQHIQDLGDNQEFTGIIPRSFQYLSE